MIGRLLKQLWFGKRRLAQRMAWRRVWRRTLDYTNTWRDRPHDYWAARLLEEIACLQTSIQYQKGHFCNTNSPLPNPIDIDLETIGSIAVNWLAMRMEDRSADAEREREEAWRNLLTR